MSVSSATAADYRRRVRAAHAAGGSLEGGMTNSFGARATLSAGGREHEIYRLDALQATYDVARLPYTLRVLLENVLRLEDGVTVTAADVEAVARWVADEEPSREISFTPARVLLQDFTGVPAIVDLAAMRDAMRDARRRSGTHQPTAARRARHRPFGAGRRVRRPASPSRATWSSSSSATASATRSCAGASDAFDELQGRPAGDGHRPSGEPRVPRARRRGPRGRAAVSRRSPTPSSAPTRTRPWSTGSACSAGASAASRPRPPCSASRSRCSSHRSSASS